MILEEAAAVAQAATARALWESLRRYRHAVRDLLEVRSLAGHSGREREAAEELVRAAHHNIRVCWALPFGEPPQWR